MPCCDSSTPFLPEQVKRLPYACLALPLLCFALLVSHLVDRADSLHLLDPLGADQHPFGSADRSRIAYRLSFTKFDFHW